MNKTFLKLFLILTPLSLFSQNEQGVGINTYPINSTAALDMSDSGKGFIAPKVSLTSILDTSTIPQPAEGLIVYNISEENGDLPKGYFYFDGQKWKALSANQEITTYFTTNDVNPNLLGYYPTGKGENAFEKISIDNTTATKDKCVQFTGENSNNHFYCGYSLTQSVNWDTAYKIAKEANGYLVCILYDYQWDFIKNNFLSNSEQEDKSNNRIWIGYNKVDYPGKMVVEYVKDANGNVIIDPEFNKPLENKIGEFLWISGKESLINWGNKTLTQGNWDVDQPSKNPDNRSGYIQSKYESSNRKWGTYNGEKGQTSTTYPFNYIIVEFLN